MLFYHGVKFEAREEYAIEYVEVLLRRYCELTGIDTGSFVSGKGHRKSTEQRRYEELFEYCERLKKYAERIKICGEERNSYSKTDNFDCFKVIIHVGSFSFPLYKVINKLLYMSGFQLLQSCNAAIVAEKFLKMIQLLPVIAHR